MPLRLPTPGGDSHRVRHPPTSILSKHKKKKAKKAKKGRKGRKKTVKQPVRHTFHEQAGAGSVGGDHNGFGAGALPFAQTDSGVTAGAPGAPRALLELTGLDAATSEGLMGALLDLVGEGKLTAAHALAAWTHEQDRLANRAWRRPGGMARMAGL